MTPLETINTHLAAIAELARQQQQTIERLSATPPLDTSGSHRHGVTIWFGDDPTPYAKTLLAAGITAVRGWVSCSGGEPSSTDLAGMARWRRAGFFTIACVHPDARRQLDIDGLAARLTAHNGDADVWELGNEPDLAKYWPAGWRDFVTRFVSPLARAMKDRSREQLLALPALGNIAQQALYENAYAEALRGIPGDFQAVHPYSTTAGDLEKKLTRMASAYKLPLLASEWDVARGMAFNEWLKFISSSVQTVRRLTKIDCFYRLRDTDSTPASQINLFDASGKPSAAWQPYQAALKE